MNGPNGQPPDLSDIEGCWSSWWELDTLHPRGSTGAVMDVKTDSLITLQLLLFVSWHETHRTTSNFYLTNLFLNDVKRATAVHWAEAWWQTAWMIRVQVQNKLLSSSLVTVLCCTNEAWGGILEPSESILSRPQSKSTLRPWFLRYSWTMLRVNSKFDSYAVNWLFHTDKSTRH